MKAIFYILLIVNVVVLMWEFRQGRVLPSVPVAGNFGEPILIVSDIKPEQPVTPLLEKAVSQPPIETVTCFEAGPFFNTRDFKSWQTRLGGFLTPLIKKAAIPVTYQVYIPALKEPAETMIKDLRTKGYRDAWIIEGESNPSRISLGLFTKKEQANSFKQALVLKEIQAEIQIRYKNKQSRFALIKGTPKTIALVDALTRDYSDIPLKRLENTENGECF
jgi:hypothetical protein